MRSPFLAAFLIIALVLSACGRDYSMKNQASMSEDDAVRMLMDVPLEGRNAFGKRNRVSMEGLVTLLQQLIASGQLKVPGLGRGATAGSFDLSSLTQILGLLQQGGGIFGIAQGLNGTTTGGGLSGIMALLQAALPIIATIAPQYAGIIQAIVTILPIVMGFMQMFKKPAKSASISFVPVFA